MELERGQVGFGSDKSEAKQDLFFNLCRQNIKADKSGKFLRRKKELHPWMPRKNMLHLTGIGCLVYDKYCLTNTATNKTLPVHYYDMAIYYYLAELFSDMLSYTDIAIVLQSEINQFFREISYRFLELEQYPYIEVTDRNSGFNPSIVYSIKNDIVIGVNSTTLGVKFYGSEYYYVVPYKRGEDIMSRISYIGYRMGVIISKSEVKICGKED